ncbi:MbtH family protein [Streptomyces sp. NPDC020875]|uniref:MbtH family protein n=1 Tax=Streptomyces sp. NPDC020875 TaxID=3154898 RepID=UPI00340A48D2
MTNPFESDDMDYAVLRNDEGQYSLWPAGVDVPDGWTVARPPGPRAECLEYVETVWTDMRPAGLIAATDGVPRRGGAGPVG